MAKYKIEYADTFDKAMKKLDRETQRFIMQWIDQHLNNVDFPTSPEYAFMFVEEVLPSFTLVESKMDTPQSRRDSLHYTIRLTPEYTKLLIKQAK